MMKWSWLETWAMIQTIGSIVGAAIGVSILIWFLWSTWEEVNGK
jgi:hypothetical protein